MRNLSGPGPGTARRRCSQAPRLKARPCPPVPPHPPVPSSPATALRTPGAFHTSGACCAVVARSISASRSVQNSPCAHKKCQIEPFLVCGESFVPDMWRGWVCRESFVPEGPGAVVVGRVVLCSCVVLVPVGGLWQRPAAAHGHRGQALRARRCPPHQLGLVADG